MEVKKANIKLLQCLFFFSLFTNLQCFCYGFDFGISGAVKKDVKVLEEKMENTIPTAPSNLIANVVSESRIDLTWQDNSSNEDRKSVV